MKIIGYLFTLAGLYALYIGELVFGGILFVVGGFLAGKLSISLRSFGVILAVDSIAYGFHQEFTPLVIGLIIIGLVLACLNNKRGRDTGDSGWGIDFDFSSDSNSSCGGSDGGDGGGGD